jgi:hypothetical protein
MEIMVNFPDTDAGYISIKNIQAYVLFWVWRYANIHTTLVFETQSHLHKAGLASN